MSAPLYNLEDSLERATVLALQDVDALDDVRIVSADVSSETELPYIAVRAEKNEELVLGAGVWQMRLTVMLCTAADETDEEIEAARRLPEPDDDDAGAAGFNAQWKTLTDTMHAQAFRATINGKETVFVWGYEVQPNSYENQERSFNRSVNIACHASPAYTTPTP
jgi:hypothetical protein